MLYEIVFNFEQLGYFWLLVALLFLLLELSTPGLFFFITFSIGAVFASGAAFLGCSFFVQCITLVTSFLITFFIFRKYLKATEYKRVPTNVDALAGKDGIIVKVITKSDSGLVKVGGEIWSAFSKNGVDILEGQTVKVDSVKGNRLMVK